MEMRRATERAATGTDGPQSDPFPGNRESPIQMAQALWDALLAVGTPEEEVMDHILAAVGVAGACHAFLSCAGRNDRRAAWWLDSVGAQAPDVADAILQACLARGVVAPWAASSSIGASLSLESRPWVTTMPAGTVVPGPLRLGGCVGLRALPRGLSAGCLYVDDCTSLEILPEDLRADHGLYARRTILETLPEGFRTHGDIILNGCQSFRTLPMGLAAGTLFMMGCTAWGRVLPSDLVVNRIFTDDHPYGASLDEARSMAQNSKERGMS